MTITQTRTRTVAPTKARRSAAVRTERGRAHRAASLRDLPFASYARKSKIVAGDGAGARITIDRQHAENRETLERLFPGEDLVIVEYDDNLSAWDPDVVRPGWERMLRDLGDGKLRGTIGWHADRYTRQPMQLEIMLSIWERVGSHLLTTRSGLITDPTMIRIEGALAASESNQKSARISSKHREIAAAGGFHGGRRRWGYEPRMAAIRESEAVVIRELVDRILAGESLASLARELTAREISAAEGGRWQGANLGLMLKRPHLAGLRTHTDPETGDVIETEATWPAIIDREKHRRLVHLLDDPARRTSYTNARRYLLAGLATCDVCGSVLRGRPKTTRDPREVYACATGRHVYRSLEQVERFVVERVTHRLERMTKVGMLKPDDPSHAEHKRLVATLNDLTDATTEIEQAHARREITTTRYLSTIAAMDSEISEIKARVTELEASAARPSDVLDGMTGPGATEKFLAADLGRQRAIIDTLCTISVKGQGKGKRGPLSPHDVVIVWKEDA